MQEGNLTVVADIVELEDDAFALIAGGVGARMDDNGRI